MNLVVGLLLLMGAIELGAPPRAGAEVVVKVTRGGAPVAGQPVLEVSAPGAVDAAQRPIGTTDAGGQVRWTPGAPGYRVLEAGEERAAVAVAVGPAMGALPGAAVGLLLVAALALGAGIAQKRGGGTT